jgi:hypothetical protein
MGAETNKTAPKDGSKVRHNITPVLTYWIDLERNLRMLCRFMMDVSAQAKTNVIVVETHGCYFCKFGP